MTRAKKQLYITYSKRYFDSDSGEVDTAEKIPSKFISESGVESLTIHNELVSEHPFIMKLLLNAEEPVEIPEKNKDYLQNLVQKKLQVSASSLNKYKKCAYKFLLEEVYNLPLPKDLNLAVGSSVHKGIELLTKSVHKTDQGLYNYLSFDEILKGAYEQFESDIDTEIRATDEIGSIDVAKEEIQRGLKAYYDYFVLNPHKPESSETKIYGVHEGIKVLGRIDNISYGPNQSAQILTVTDYKTSSKFPSITEFLGLTKNADKAHLRQLMFYRLLLESAEDLKTKRYSGHLRSLKIEYINTKEGEVKIFEIPASGIYEYHPRSNSKKTAEFDLDTEYAQLKSDLVESFASIKNLYFERTEDRRHCEFCAFKRHCGR
jgi:hypothetical protein